jgi:hypothetical protein
VIFEDSGQIPLGFKFLEAQFTEAEEHIYDLLNHLGIFLNHPQSFVLETFKASVRLGSESYWNEDYKSEDGERLTEPQTMHGKLLLSQARYGPVMMGSEHETDFLAGQAEAG